MIIIYGLVLSKAPAASLSLLLSSVLLLSFRFQDCDFSHQLSQASVLSSLILNEPMRVYVLYECFVSLFLT